MPDPLIDTPESPPHGPIIPEGLATKLGKYGAAATLLLALIVEIFDVTLDESTKQLMLGALTLVLTTIAGRMAQSAAALRDAPSPHQLDDFSGEEDLELEEVVPPDEGQLKTAYPEEMDEYMPEGTLNKPHAGS